MTWLQRYRIRHYVRNSIWIIPVAAMVIALVCVQLLHWLDERMGWQADLNPETTRVVLGMLAGAMFTFIVFVCSSLLLVVQLASAQLTPRVIGTMFQDPVTKLTLAVFVFAFAFALSALVRIDNSVPLLSTRIAAYGCAASIGFFLYLIDHVGKMLRPSGALQSVASQAHRVINSVYRRRLKDAGTPSTETAMLSGQSHTSTVTSPGVGVVLAFDVQGIVALGVRHDCLIELVPQVGDFVAPGDPLFRIHGGDALPVDPLRQSIAIGAERTMEQDPALAFRVIVDIASKGLSPAINDPTTAVLAIDRIHHLLRHIGSRRLDDEKVRDFSGRVRLVYRTPDWEDFVALAVTEIRHFGASSIQVARRLRAMLENLIRTLPEERAPPLLRELKLLKKSAERSFQDPEDQALADVSDSQGVGGTSVDRRRPVSGLEVRALASGNQTPEAMGK
jgi:uncharacterized membrane protein